MPNNQSWNISVIWVLTFGKIKGDFLKIQENNY
jgi:hypothetical protein